MQKRIILAAMAALMLTGCATQPKFKPSADMVGKVDLVKDVSGMEKLETNDHGAFAETLNEKYGNGAIKDASGNLGIKVDASASSPDMGGMSMNIGADGDIDFMYEKDSEMLGLDGTLSVNIFGMNVPVEIEAYVDNKEKMTYSHVVAMGEDNGWEKEKMDDDGEKKD